MVEPAKENSKDELKTLIAEATLKYSIKDYDAAAELYSQATELQATLNGELLSENADLLYCYGKCLYHVALRNSDILGSKVTGGRREEDSEQKNNQKLNTASKPNKPVDETKSDQKDNAGQAGGKLISENKAYFQFTGDENFDDSSTDEDNDDKTEKEANGVEEEVEDDFVIAYEILDLARVLLLKRIDEARENEGMSETTDDSQIGKIKERLADTHDLQAEISLEGEKFPSAVMDFKAALKLKQELFPLESSLIAEAHYKLSLALEFSSVTQQQDTNGEIDGATATTVDEAMREEAAKEMETAIASCELRIEKEEASLKTDPGQNQSHGKSVVTRENIDDVKKMVKEMEQRLVDLRQPPPSVNDVDGTATLGEAHLSGILASVLGESPAIINAKLEEASKTAVDLTNLVKRQKPTANGQSEAAVEPVVAKSNGKRRVDFADEVIDATTGKKAKLEED